MDRLITIRTANFPHELAVLQGHLESEEIDCFIQDELMSQTTPYLANAIGGAKLQIWESDLPRASEILRDAGYAEKADGVQAFPFYRTIESATASAPLLRDMRGEFRVLIALTTIILIAIVIAYFAF